MKIIKRIEHYIKNEVHNPLSTMTNLTYVLIGYLLLEVNILIGSLLIGLGAASTGFHWTRRDAWHKLDIVAIYYVFAVLAGWLWFGNWGIIPGIIIGIAAHWSFTDYSRYSRQVIGSLGALCLIPFWIQSGINDLLHVMMWFGFAFAVSTLADRFDPEQNGKWYDVYHGIWHVFSGIGIYYLIL